MGPFKKKIHKRFFATVTPEACCYLSKDDEYVKFDLKTLEKFRNVIPKILRKLDTLDNPNSSDESSLDDE
jgi:hypothetical protein